MVKLCMVLAVLVFLGNVTAQAQDFRGSYFGDTMEQVREIEGMPRLTLGDGTMVYSLETGSLTFSFTPYRTRTGTRWVFIGGRQYWDSDQMGPDEHTQKWKINLETFTQQYGTPLFLAESVDADGYRATWVYRDATIILYRLAGLGGTVSHYVDAVPLSSPVGQVYWTEHLRRARDSQ